jgi:hypothetical protein
MTATLPARSNGVDFMVGFLNYVVIARSEATKQSIFPLVAPWIASLRSQ